MAVSSACKMATVGFLLAITTPLPHSVSGLDCADCHYTYVESDNRRAKAFVANQFDSGDESCIMDPDLIDSSSQCPFCSYLAMAYVINTREYPSDPVSVYHNRAGCIPHDVADSEGSSDSRCHGLPLHKFQHLFNLLQHQRGVVMSDHPDVSTLGGLCHCQTEDMCNRHISRALHGTTARCHQCSVVEQDGAEQLDQKQRNCKESPSEDTLVECMPSSVCAALWASYTLSSDRGNSTAVLWSRSCVARFDYRGYGTTCHQSGLYLDEMYSVFPVSHHQRATVTQSGMCFCEGQDGCNVQSPEQLISAAKGPEAVMCHSCRHVGVLSTNTSTVEWLRGLFGFADRTCADADDALPARTLCETCFSSHVRLTIRAEDGTIGDVELIDRGCAPWEAPLGCDTSQAVTLNYLLNNYGWPAGYDVMNLDTGFCHCRGEAGCNGNSNDDVFQAAANEEQDEEQEVGASTQNHAASFSASRWLLTLHATITCLYMFTHI